MTVSFKNGLDYEDLQKIAHAINPVVFDPELMHDLSTGVNAGLAITSRLQSAPPFVLQILNALIPGEDMAGQINSIVRVLNLAKGLLEA